VIWFVGFGGYVWIWDNRAKSEFYGWQLKMCDAVLSERNGSLGFFTKREDRDERADENAAEYLNCREAAERLFLSEMNTRYSGIPILLAIDVGVIVICWLVAWLGIVSVRWIRRGLA
jgi:hypothetical protein